MEQTIHRLNRKDMEISKALVELVGKAEFNIKGADAAKFGALLQWLTCLEKRIEETLKPLPPPVLREMSPAELKEARAAKKREDKK